MRSIQTFYSLFLVEIEHIHDEDIPVISHMKTLVDEFSTRCGYVDQSSLGYSP